MKSRYIIGFFCAIFICVLLLSAGYRATYEHVMEKQASGEKISGTESIAAEGTNVTGENEETGYYLCELQGYVVVYLSDRKTIYEITDISLNDLPAEVQQEISEGKHVRDARELYAFLQNYSS